MAKKKVSRMQALGLKPLGVNTPKTISRRLVELEKILAKKRLSKSNRVRALEYRNWCRVYLRKHNVNPNLFTAKTKLKKEVAPRTLFLPKFLSQMDVVRISEIVNQRVEAAAKKVKKSRKAA